MATTVCVFCIGTGHTHAEDANVLVKLWKACRFSDLGVEGNHTADGTAGILGKVSHALGRAERITKIAPAMNGGWTWINEGQNQLGIGLKAQTAANVELINALNPARVVLVGHSRGAVLSIGIAAALYKQALNTDRRKLLPNPECYLFLYDPVKRAAAGDADFAKLYPNIRDIRIIVMEDEDKVGGRFFGLLNITGPIKDDYVRLPGTHGTATQVTGFPIGQVGYMLAVEWLTTAAKVPMAADVEMSNRNFCREYARINRLNPVIDGKRRVNNLDGPLTSKRLGEMTIDKEHAAPRTKVLDEKAGRNRFRGTNFFINEDHERRFKAEYPQLARYMAEARGQTDADKDKRRLFNQDPGSYLMLKELLLLPP